MHLPACHGVSCSRLTLLSKQLLPVSTFNGTNQARIVTEEAADAAYPVVMVPLEVTHTALATAEVLARIRAMGSPCADMVRYGCGGVLERRERRRAEAGGPQHPLCGATTIKMLLLAVAVVVVVARWSTCLRSSRTRMRPSSTLRPAPPSTTLAPSPSCRGAYRQCVGRRSPMAAPHPPPSPLHC